MPAGNDFNNQQIKQQAQYLNMRGAQIAEQNAGQETKLGSQPKAQGSKKQLVGTIIGIVVMIGVLIVLKALDVI